MYWVWKLNNIRFERYSQYSINLYHAFMSEGDCFPTTCDPYLMKGACTCGLNGISFTICPNSSLSSRTNSLEQRSHFLVESVVKGLKLFVLAVWVVSKFTRLEGGPLVSAWSRLWLTWEVFVWAFGYFPLAMRMVLL